MKIVIATAHSHTWFLTQTFLVHLKKNTDPHFQVVLVDNSWRWSPSILGVAETEVSNGIEIVDNIYPSRYHASALDYVVEYYDADYLVTLETDCILMRPDWLTQLLSAMKESDYAAGAWHHELFINPSIAIYRMSALKEMMKWCRANRSHRAYWGPNFTNEMELYYEEQVEVLGPFQDRRGWPRGTVLKEPPTGQLKGPGHYEPGQMLYHWAMERGYTKTIIPTVTTRDPVREIPLGTHYGGDSPWGIHLWAGTRALDILKHPVTDPAISSNSRFWLEREAKMWLEAVPKDIQEETVRMVKQHGWFKRDMDEREKDAVKFITTAYRAAGIPL